MKKYGAKDLERWGSCKEGIALAEELAPNGATVMEMLCMDKVPNDYIHWIKDRIAFTEEETMAYLSRMNIINSTSLHFCENIVNSNFVVKSKDVKNSKCIFESSNVTNCKDVVNTDEAENSSQIFYSTMIDGSDKVCKGTNIVSSTNICNSTMVARCVNVIDSSTVFDSSEIVNCNTVSSSHFCQNCTDISNCLFCDGLSGAEYHIFNKPIDPKMYELFEKQYLKYMSVHLSFIAEWPVDLVVGVQVTPTRKFDDWYHSIPEKFWKWVRTLPNFDSMLLYNITMLPEILIDKPQ